MNDSFIISTLFQAMRPPAGLHVDDASYPRLPHLQGTGSLPSAFPVTAFATASIGRAAQALADYIEARFGQQPAVSIDRRLASFWFDTSLSAQGWQVPSVRDPITGDYRARDGWIRLHTNAPHHQAAALSVLKMNANHGKVAQSIADWKANDLETAIIQAGAAPQRCVPRKNGPSIRKAKRSRLNPCSILKKAARAQRAASMRQSSDPWQASRC